MSIAAVAWAMKARVGSSTRKAVLIALCNYADADGYCWPSQETIAADTELTDRSVLTALKALEEDGFIERSARPRRADKTRQSDLIRIVFSRSSTPKEFRDGLPETDGKTIPKGIPDLPEGASGKPSGEPSIEPAEGARARPARPTMLPEDWKLEARHVSVGIREGLNAKQLDRASRKFVLHHREVGRPLKDWDAAWERWIMKEAELLGVAKEPELPIGQETGVVLAGKVYAARDSAQLDAWQDWSREVRRKTFPTDARGGWWFETEWPPGHPNAASEAA